MSRLDSMMSRFAGPLLSRQLGRQGGSAVIRIVRGDEQARHSVPGCIVTRDNSAAAAFAADAGYILDQSGERFIELALLEVPVSTETDSKDKWEFDGLTWNQIGEPVGRDAGMMTIVLKRTDREATGGVKARRR